jgi:hypothetical protein
MEKGMMGQFQSQHFIDKEHFPIEGCESPKASGTNALVYKVANKVKQLCVLTISLQTRTVKYLDEAHEIQVLWLPICLLDVLSHYFTLDFIKITIFYLSEIALIGMHFIQLSDLEGLVEVLSLRSIVPSILRSETFLRRELILQRRLLLWL